MITFKLKALSVEQRLKSRKKDRKANKMPRRSSRLSTTTRTPPRAAKPDNNEDSNMLNEVNDDNDDDAPTPARKYMFDGVAYDTYSEMVQAKRQRNQQVLEASGLLTMVAEQKRLKAEQHKRGLQKRRQSLEATAFPVSRRKSRRLAGIESDGMYVDRESAGRFTLAKDDRQQQQQGGLITTTTVQRLVVGNEHTERAEPEFYRGRVNDGGALSIAQAVELAGPKWVHETSVADAEQLVRQVLQPLTSNDAGGNTTTTTTASKDQKTQDEASPKSVVRSGMAITEADTEGDDSSHYYLPHNLQTQVDALKADNPDQCVAKVVPDRIYGIAVHPAMDRVIVAAGDKVGHVGIWNVDSSFSSVATTDDNKKTTTHDGVHLFRFHSGAASCLEWTHNALFSASYDGTVRVFDVAAEKFTQNFATYDDTAEFAGQLGAGMDTGYKYWMQYATIDERFSTEQCFFLSTSVGTAMHIDLRVGQQGRVTFHEQWSEKKINTLSLHPNGYSMISSGLDCTVKLWDLRKVKQLKKMTTGLSSLQKPIVAYHGGKSINSAYFSPSGKHVLTTTMNNKLDLLDDFHLHASATTTTKNIKYIKPTKSLYHDNHTGRWLSTFMARFHPSMDIFCVGSMQQPRRVEIFTAAAAAGTKHNQHLLRGITGDALTAVVSRCCFHPCRDRLIVVGGNSSGRVTVVR